jgi:hypothetical protein
MLLSFKYLTTAIILEKLRISPVDRDCIFIGLLVYLEKDFNCRALFSSISACNSIKDKLALTASTTGLFLRIK